MDIVYVHGNVKFDLTMLESIVDQLPDRFVLSTTVQFSNSIPLMKEFFESKGKTVELFNGTHTQIQGQMLGCCDVKQKGPFLYIGDGHFHPKELQVKTEDDVYVFNPMSQKFYLLDKTEVDDLLKRKKGAYAKFLMSKHVGIIVTSKAGQQYLKKSLQLKKQLRDKTCYIFFYNNIDFMDLENYPFIECYINTACPRIGIEDIRRTTKPIINEYDLREFGYYDSLKSDIEFR